VNRHRIDNSFSGDFSEQIAVDQEPLSKATDPHEHVSAATVEARCLACDSWAVYPLGLVYASSTETRAAMSPQGVASPCLTSWTVDSHPPEKMTTSTSFTLALLLWSPCIFLLAQMLYTRTTTGRFIEDSPSVYVVALAVGVIAWAAPALRRRRQARRYNSGPWEEEMRAWHDARVCLKCGYRPSRLDRLLNNSVKEGLS
jgi:hypothetical protein